MKKSEKYLDSLYREFGDNAQKVLDFIEKNVNDCADNREGNTYDDNCGMVVPIPAPSFSSKEYVLIFDTDKKAFVDKENVDNHDKSNLEVVMVHQNGAFVVSKKDLGEHTLKTKDRTENYIEEECKAVFDFDGKKNTELLIKAELNIELQEGTYIPALGEMIVMRRNIEDVNECLKFVEGEEFDMRCNYWTSSETCYEGAWSVNFRSGNLHNGLLKRDKFAVRSVTAFTSN